MGRVFPIDTATDSANDLLVSVAPEVSYVSLINIQFPDIQDKVKGIAGLQN